MRRFAAASAVCWLAGLSLSLSGGKWTFNDMVIAAIVPAVLGAKLICRQSAQAAACLMLFAASFVYGMLWEQNGVSQLPEAAESFTLTGQIASPVKIDGDRIRFVLHGRVPVRERVMATVRAASPEELQAAAAWRRGDAVTVTGELSLPAEARNFGQFDYRRYLDRLRIWRTVDADGLAAVETAAPQRTALLRYGLMRWTDAWRSRLDARIAQLYGEHRGLMSGLLIGLPDKLEEQRFMVFSRLGLTHIIAISGLHVAIVVGCCLGVLRLLRFTRETSLAAAMLIIPPYILLSGASPSVVRAGIMGMIGLYAARRGWLKDGLNILAAAALVMTAWNPYLIYNISFQLSFAVTAGLILYSPALMRLMPRIPKQAAGAVAVAAAAQLTSFPLSIYYFNQFSLLSFPANLLIVPLYSLIVLPGGYASLALSALPLPIAGGIAKAVAWPIHASYWIMDLFDAIPGMLTIWPSPPLSWIAVYFLLLSGLLAAALRRKEGDAELHPRRMRMAGFQWIGGAVLFSLWLVLGYQLENWKDRGSVAFLDVGQGDAILIRSPSDSVILVDGGGTLAFGKPEDQWRRREDPYEVGEDLIVPLLKKRGIRSIDYMIATHGDADHIGGLAAVVEHIPVKRILFNGTVRLNEHSEKFFRSALKRGVPVHAAASGQRIPVDRLTEIEILHPAEGKLVPAGEQNSRSVVFILTMRDATFLFTGDMDAAAEREVLDRLSLAADDGQSLPDSVDVLKIAHHGSKTSTTAPWLHYWSPRFAVISVGERNIYRHPSDLVLRRLDDRGIQILRTDRHGEIRFHVHPAGTRWKTKRGPDVKM